MLASAVVALAIAAFLLGGFGREARVRAVPVGVVVAAPPQAAEGDGWVQGAIGPGDGLFQAMLNMGMNQQQFLEVYNTLREEVELVNLQAGERLSIKWNADSSRVQEFAYRPNQIETHRLVRNAAGDSLTYRFEQEETTLQYRLISGVIRQGSSLDQTLIGGGLHASLTGVVVGVLLCKINFQTDARHGDQFQVLLREELFRGAPLAYRTKVLYTRYVGSRAGTHEAFRYAEDDPKSTFNAHYTEDGTALISSGLRYPLDRLHITSPFGWRRHPVTGARAMHEGVDYRGATGDPVYAVAPGVVAVSTSDQYSGNKISIRHADGTSSWYLHLSKRGVNPGSKVVSRQIIGRVGNTGRSTGPHLHFGFKDSRGKWMNPLSKRMIATPKLEGARLARLKQQIAEIRKQLQAGNLVHAEARDPSKDRSTMRGHMPWERMTPNRLMPLWPEDGEGTGVWLEP